jgi:hypothetical protein
MSPEDSKRVRVGKTARDKANGHNPAHKNRKGCTPHCSGVQKVCGCAQEPRGHLRGMNRPAWVKQQRAK